MFKIEVVKIDIDLDFSDVEGIKENEKILKPVIKPVGQKIIDWGEKVKAANPGGENAEEITAKLKEKYDGNIELAAREMVENIDFWYQKGAQWWLDKLELAHIMAIFNYLIAEIFKVKKK